MLKSNNLFLMLQDLPLEMGNSSFNNISTAAPNSEFPGLPVTHYGNWI